jgi:glycosyltransferase involved in cell wall biosynthesis
MILTRARNKCWRKRQNYENQKLRLGETAVNPDLPVSVVIPTLGREDYLRTVLEGLFVQTYTNFEIIVVDQSDQISPAIVELGRSSPRQFRLIHDTDKGLARARNIGLKHSEGKLFLGLEDDLKIVHNDLIRAHV